VFDSQIDGTDPQGEMALVGGLDVGFLVQRDCLAYASRQTRNPLPEAPELLLVEIVQPKERPSRVLYVQLHGNREEIRMPDAPRQCSCYHQSS
jgi:hypothetical protein